MEPVNYDPRCGIVQNDKGTMEDDLIMTTKLLAEARNALKAIYHGMFGAEVGGDFKPGETMREVVEINRNQAKDIADGLRELGRRMGL